MLEYDILVLKYNVLCIIYRLKGNKSLFRNMTLCINHYLFVVCTGLLDTDDMMRTLLLLTKAKTVFKI